MLVTPATDSHPRVTVHADITDGPLQRDVYSAVERISINYYWNGGAWTFDSRWDIRLYGGALKKAAAPDVPVERYPETLDAWIQEIADTLRPTGGPEFHTAAFEVEL